MNIPDPSTQTIPNKQTQKHPQINQKFVIFKYFFYFHNSNNNYQIILLVTLS
jgi:hypothetical protein